ncbi:hypothetical protein [Sporosarcina sp. P7]|uniref:hypothetical protein n=1 Tax=Sporosarcina sp. P7 TaxID=2048244 RepID=UPI000C167A07|nr:hypothetical protein [Sporosarcina sp. P7]PID24097.1 hypothetical protein CSV60_11845 [Sporosarcina sp. P7]
MTTSEKSQMNIKKNETDFDKLRDDFIRVLADFGVKKVEDIPVGSHRKPEKSDHGVWIIK